MLVEEIIFTSLAQLVAGRVFPDVADAGTQLPFITFQQVGGASVNFLDSLDPSKQNSRFQINVWAANRFHCAELARQAENILRGAPLQTTVLGAPVAVYDAETKTRGSQQDFSFWFST